MGSGSRIFISSTCYDLLDLRAEVELHLRGMGLTPILSDRPASEFETAGYKDSIETCLANVRTSDAFICILSQRYGPSLGAAGFKDVSATHLEYEEAKARGLPIYMYVRDRLLGEYSVWKKNGGPSGSATVKFAWVPRDNERIFNFVHEHQALVSGSPDSNWLWAFKDSCELKERVSIDFRARSAPAMLRRLIEEGRIPILKISSRSSVRQAGAHVLSLLIKCVGQHAAFAPQISGHNGTQVGSLQDITPENPSAANVAIPIQTSGPSRVEVKLEYETALGHAIEGSGQI
ncbi:DUF4062 domain-containing protein [Polyangium jinanense]|uniref:DUF4062 domain-containing protein n=1 Tax=Polyangium jinanense TaxID=2829994 RepID=UPI00234060F3|nr:DUF4062 domain-containing protein [Polyangium jinanense]MDC3962530.1 DUF4062 domain-containing protein [Polyangium jinanense]